MSTFPGEDHFDPPYQIASKPLYRYNFVPDQHGELRQALADLKSPWITSYNDGEHASLLFSEIEGTYDVSSTATERIFLRF